jgi:hypothetical protein
MKRAIAALCAVCAMSFAVPAVSGASVIRHGLSAPAASTTPIIIWPGRTLPPPLVLPPGDYYPPILTVHLPPG